MAVHFFRQIDVSAETEFMDTTLPWPRLTSSDRSTVAPSEAQGMGGTEITCEDLHKKDKPFLLNPQNFYVFAHSLEAPTWGQWWPHFNWIPKAGLSTLGKVQHPKAPHRMLKLNPALLLSNEAFSSPAAKGPKAANTLGQVCSSAQSQGSASASLFIQHWSQQLWSKTASFF